MNLFEYHSIDWQERNLLKKHFGLRSSMPIKTISGRGPDVIEDDGMREGDIAPLAEYTPEQALALAKGLSMPTVEPIEVKEEKPEIEKSAKKTKKTKKTK